MAMTVNRRKDSRVPKVFMHKVADIRGGVSVNVTELGGDFLHEGAVLSAPDNGICHVVKVAVLTAQALNSATTFNVKKGHNFKVGDVVMADEGGVAYPITAIDGAEKTHDVITIKTKLNVQIEKGGFLIEAKSQTAGSDAALKYIPLAVAGTGKQILPNSNLDTDAWLIGVTHGNALPECVAKHLKGIINY